MTCGQIESKGKIKFSVIDVTKIALWFTLFAIGFPWSGLIVLFLSMCYFEGLRREKIKKIYKRNKILMDK